MTAILSHLVEPPHLRLAAPNHTEVEDQEKAENSEVEDSEEDTTMFIFEHYSSTQAQEEEDNMVGTTPRNMASTPPLHSS